MRRVSTERKRKSRETRKYLKGNKNNTQVTAIQRSNWHVMGLNAHLVQDWRQSAKVTALSVSQCKEGVIQYYRWRRVAVFEVLPENRNLEFSCNP